MSGASEFRERVKRIASYAHARGRVMLGPEYRDAVEAAISLLEAEGVRCGVRREGESFGFVVHS